MWKVDHSESGKMSEIQRFYDGQNIFITGGTGFLGKILIEKLLRSLPKIGTVYILIRPKRGKQMRERLDQFFTSPIFEVLENINPNFREKIVGISGDGTQPGLGMSVEDRIRLVNEVSIIFHAAATVKFNERLPVAVAINVNAVKELIILCRACKKLKSVVYVSTAFSNCIHKEIKEKIYPAPMTYEQINLTVKVMETKNLPEEDEEKLTNSILDKFPNTYAFTKAIAENMINEYAKDLPFCIYRFSIALSTYKEPFPGWIDAFQGLNTSIAQIGRGFIHCLYGDPQAKIDIVPADYASNALIASAWESGTVQRSKDDDVPVYNFVSGTDNPVLWGEMKEILVTYGWNNPTYKNIYYPTGFYVKSPMIFTICNFFLHLIPALIGDVVFKALGRKPVFYDIYSRGIKLIDSLGFFMTQDWTFETRRVRSLWNKLSEEDKELLPFDITSFNWNDTIPVYLKGIKKFILKDEFTPEYVAKARLKVRILYFVHQIVKLFFGSLFLWLIWNIFCFLSNILFS